jgi:metallo-beta-lactamase class B
MLSVAKLSAAVLFTAVLSTFSLLSSAQDQKDLPVQEAWIKDYKPFRIAGNLYYVGSWDLACYLITTTDGHVLINTGVAESASMIKKHIEQLGFRFSDIQILLAAHAHYDHTGAIAAIKEMTGAKLMINENDVKAMEDGGNSDYLFGGKGSMFKPAKVDRVLKNEKDTIEFGGMKIIALHHPGHTKGATSFLFDVKDEHRSYRVLIANMPTILDGTKAGMVTYPDVAKDYAYTLDELKKLQFDIWFCSHASQFDLHKKRKPADAYKPDAFADRKGYDAIVSDLYDAYVKKLGNNQ